jgi:hypothetical protein
MRRNGHATDATSSFTDGSSRSVSIALSVLSAVAYWFWAAFITIVVGGFGAALKTCEEGCRDDFPPPLEPWRWGDYYAYPEVTFIAFAGLIVASAFAVFIFRRRPIPATLALLGSLALLSYPFFAGLTDLGRTTFTYGFGSFLAVIALGLLLASSVRTPRR